MDLILSSLITELRESNNLSKVEFAVKCNMNRSNVHNIEGNHSDTQFSTLVKLATGLNISLPNLMELYELKKIEYNKHRLDNVNLQKTNRSLIGQLVTDIRTEQRLSVKDLAQRSGMRLSMLYNLERLNRDIQLDTLDRLCDGLGITLADFVMRYKKRKLKDGI